MGIPVLVIDANVDNAKLIKKSLEADQRFQVTLATRAIEALMRFTETRFRLAIVDFGLPDLNGIELIRQIRGIDENIIVVAILNDEEPHPKGLEKLAINLILNKSVYLSELPQKLPQLFKFASSKTSPGKPVDPSKLQKQVQRHGEELPKSIQGNVIQAKPSPKKATEQKIPKKQPLAEKPSLEENQPLEVSQQEEEQPPVEKAEDSKGPAHESQPVGEAIKEEPALKEEISEDSITIPPWLKEPAQVEKQMASLEQEHSAYATLLSIGNTPWTYSEKLSENQAHGIVRLLSEHDEGLRSKGALIRYIRLGGSGDDYLLYAIPVVGDINLSMIFSMDTPFSVARRQSHRLSRLLVEQDPRIKSDAQEKPSIEEEPEVEKSAPASQDEDEPLLPGDWMPGPKISTEKVEPSVLPSSPAIEEVPEIEPKRERVMSPSLLAAPEITPIPDDWMPKEPRPTTDLPFLESEPAQPKKTVELEPIKLAQQEPQYYLPFTAILLPRFPQHRLTGSLGNQLENWLKDICVAWGWRVDHIDLRSEFLRFTFSLSPDVAPAQAVQHLANNLSSRILNAFPNLTNDLPSGQFWAKSYLLTAGSDVGKDRLASFIETTRKEQGLVN